MFLLLTNGPDNLLARRADSLWIRKSRFLTGLKTAKSDAERLQPPPSTPTLSITRRVEKSRTKMRAHATRSHVRNLEPAALTTKIHAVELTLILVVKSITEFAQTTRSLFVMFAFAWLCSCYEERMMPFGETVIHQPTTTPLITWKLRTVVDDLQHRTLSTSENAFRS